MVEQKPHLVGGRYELAEFLGRGGMAEVRKGTDTRLGRVVAVKRLRTDLASDATFQARFRREAQSAASLNHPMIVAVYDTGEEPAADGSGVSQPYIVMEYVAGRTLRDALREGRKILPERALEITRDVLSALDYSHRAGIIHRDIKPGNVMLTPAGDVKVMDFGIARAISDASSTMTQTAAVVGTAQYLSPEQARGENVDSRSDVYSAGCLLYELLTGRPPFVGDSPVAVAYQHVREQAQPPSDHDTDLTPEIDAIVMRALAKRVEDRYQSAAAMRSDIERYLDGRPVQTTAPVPVAAAVAGGTHVAARPVPEPVPAAVPVEEDERRAPVGLIITIALLLIACLVAGYLAWGKLFPDAPSQVAVPDVVGQSQEAATLAIADAGLTVGDPVYENSNRAEGKVISTDPTGDTFVDEGSTVVLTVSLGKAEVSVPDVTNYTRAQAISTLTSAGLDSEVVQQDSDQPAGTVIDQTPEAGTEVEDGSSVTLYVSKGPKAVPDVIGDQRNVAKQKIAQRGFTAVVREDPTSTEPAGTVVDQFPTAGTKQPQGSDVLIVISTYTEPTETPSATDSATSDPSASDSASASASDSASTPAASRPAAATPTPSG
ncbi:Stk1 family PASTA domain-containing Ser/Thr kinase [Nocardioides sp. GY 10127]|uniref:Stk1 family PASTA domain-containing Ser/Thr kinase n=1 Tax=Nocardioides sp. GY 10127 TaxID=2569762 RepID=UPI0010A88E87|nr:Stk1 family PASTA domain-containing Ser/Thr kinase [Nocardioides sp. GY 10127]TIC82776.1 Stk1 family PASTA domain-containing Ser/Thr kinase [Nocardioides sp. GY 10127]